MADMLATVADVAARLQVDVGDVHSAGATLLLETATGLVQAEVKQRLVTVAGEAIELLGTTEAWLWLPERPVTSVTSVKLDGTDLTAGTDYKRFGARLWREDGWSTYVDAPSTIEVTYSHGYAAGAQKLQVARGIVLAMAVQTYSNPSGATGFRIDDYSEQYQQAADAMELSEHACAALRKAYRRSAGLVKV